MDKWLKIIISAKQVTANEHLKLEDAISLVHEANDHPLFWLGLFESIPRPSDGSRVYFLSPGSEEYLAADIAEYSCCRTPIPKASQVRAAGAPLHCLFLLEPTKVISQA